MTPSITHTKVNEFFNKYCKQELLDLYNNYGENKTNNLFSYKEYNLKNSRDQFYIVDNKEIIPYEALDTLQSDAPRTFKYSMELSGLSGKVFQAEHYFRIVDIINAISDLDINIGNKILNKYHQFCANSVEVLNTSENIVVMKNAITKYLQENDLYKTAVDITYDPKDDQGVTKWFQDVHKVEFKDLPSYNDLDYTPFLFVGKDNKEYYLLEDVASDQLFIYNSINENSGAWYCMARNDFKDSDDNMHDALFDSNGYINKNIEENLTIYTLIAEYVEEKVTKATSGIDDLNSMQSYIYGQLHVDKKVSLDIDQSFDYMLANFRVDHDYYKKDIDEIHFFKFLKEIANDPGTLYYHRYQYHSSHENKPNMENIEDRIVRAEDTNYSHLRFLSKEHQEQILTYIKEKMVVFGTNKHLKKHLDAIENVLTNANDYEEGNELKNVKKLKIVTIPKKEM